jgi:type I site-specific restriction endonuclease
VRIRTANIDPNKRLYVATQQWAFATNNFRRDFFDLIIFDEEHRSIFNRTPSESSRRVARDPSL